MNHAFIALYGLRGWTLPNKNLEGHATIRDVSSQLRENKSCPVHYSLPSTPYPDAYVCARLCGQFGLDDGEFCHLGCEFLSLSGLEWGNRCSLLWNGDRVLSGYYTWVVNHVR